MLKSWRCLADSNLAMGKEVRMRELGGCGEGEEGRDVMDL
jgi:hypothetical protein